MENGTITISWLPQPKMYEYTVEYREADKPEAEWFAVKSNDVKVAIYDLVPGRKYEYRVGGYCSLCNKTLGDVHGFMAPDRDLSRNMTCGMLPDIRLTNKTPLKEMEAGEQIMIGDFPLKVLQVSGSGSFTGYGYITVPLLGYNRVKVKFDNITVNTDRQLLIGIVETTFDKFSNQIVSVDTVLQAVQDLATIVNDLAHLTIDKDYVLVKEMADSVRPMAKEELPEALKQRAVDAADKLENSKKAYDEAKKEFDAAGTPEEKAAAKEKMDKSKEQFESAKKEVEAVQKEKDALVDAVADLIIKAARSLKSDYSEQQRKKITDDYDQSRRAMDAGIEAAVVTMKKGRLLAPAGDSTAAVVIAVTPADNDPDNKDAAQLNENYRRAEASLNKMRAVDILDRDIVNKQYYTILLKVVKPDSKNLVDFINEQRKAKVPEEDIVKALKQKLEEGLINALSRK